MKKKERKRVKRLFDVELLLLDERMASLCEELRIETIGSLSADDVTTGGRDEVNDDDETVALDGNKAEQIE